jgi:hypothetical protein
MRNIAEGLCGWGITEVLSCRYDFSTTMVGDKMKEVRDSKIQAESRFLKMRVDINTSKAD